MKKYFVIAGIAGFVFSFSMCHKAGVFPDDGYDERLSGGEATVFDASSKAFTHSIAGLNDRDAYVHAIGDKIFDQSFVAPPSPIFTGLGPVYNNVSCVNCHRNDGEGIPTAGTANSGLLMRISQLGTDEHGGPLGIDGFGAQVQDQAVIGAQPEASVSITYRDSVVTYPDGTTVTLRKPSYALFNPYIPLPANYMLSPRLAPHLVGMGLLEIIPESTILSFVDANDANKDGITGKANYVYNSYTNKTELGRFGLKANTPTLLMQIATAFQQDMGITSYAQPVEAAFGQTQMNVVHGDVQPEMADTILNYVVYYMQTTAVPARRNVTDADVRRGQILFTENNCSGCHKPTIQTGTNLAVPALSNQRIHPYTDLLLHDMGDGLADGRPDYLASGSQWRTMPLWGTGLLALTNGTAYYLHDGRARTFEEAILWHDGEAKNSKEKFMQLSKTDRDKLIKFLQSL